MYEDQVYEVIEARMLDRVSNKMDKREGSIIFDATAPASVEIQNLYLELDAILNETFADTATREYLIRRAKERGLTPYPAYKAILKAVSDPADLDIPIGKRFSLEELNYVITEKITDGEYMVECETPGEIGNKYFGRLIPIDYIRGLKSIEIVELLIPGEDEEGTNEFRERYFNSFDNGAFGGNVADYLEKTNSIPGVGSTKVTRVWNSDISPALMIPSASVDSWYENIIGSLSEDVKPWLTEVYTAAKQKKLTVGGSVKITILDSTFARASSVLIDTVQTALDPVQNAGEGLGKAPIGHVVLVDTPEDTTVDISFTLVSDTPYSSLEGQIREVIEEYFTSLRKNWANVKNLVVRIAQIESRILDIPDVIDIQHTKLNGEEENLMIEPFAVPILGEITND